MASIQKIQKKNSKAKLIETVNEINTKIENYAKNTNSKYGTGGMATKIEAAKICLLAGCYMAITNGNSNNPINKLYQKKNCTSESVSNSPYSNV